MKYFCEIEVSPIFLGPCGLWQWKGMEDWGWNDRAKALVDWEVEVEGLSVVGEKRKEC